MATVALKGGSDEKSEENEGLGGISQPSPRSAFRRSTRKRGPSRLSIYRLFKDNFEETMPGEHFWKDVPEGEEEEFFDTEEDFNSKFLDPKTYTVVAIGTTGTGKSSVIRMFCGDTVSVSHDSKSHTKEVAIFEEIGTDKNDNRTWMDTQGTDDSDMDDTDEKILKSIFKKLYQNQQNKVKVMWCVAGDMDRQKGEYRRQADFIASLGLESESPHSIFESTVIIQKMGQLKPRERHLRGVIEAAITGGATWGEGKATDYCMGFKCLDYFDHSNDDTYQTLLESETPEDKMQMLGYMKSDRMMQLIRERLDSLPAFMIKFQDKRCYKCSLRGDPRYVYNKCHYKSKTKHLLPKEDFHPKDLIWKHMLDTYTFHSGKIEKFHDGNTEWFHPMGGRTIEVDNPDKSKGTLTHRGKYVVKSGCCVGPDTWDCCDAKEEDAPGCMLTLAKMEITRFDCCDSQTGEEEGDRGCTERFTCCLTMADETGRSQGCKSKWDCCDVDITDESNSKYDGCTTKWKCCEANEDNEGCQQVWECCDLPKAARGCQDRWQCCRAEPDDPGCIVVCSNCDVRWGHLPGCCWPDVNQDGFAVGIDPVPMDPHSDSEDSD